MASLITYFKEKGISYESISPSSRYPSSNAFDNDKDFFACYELDEVVSFWQVSFAMPVTIESYTFSAMSGWDFWPTVWSVSYSLDNKTFTLLPSYGIYDLKGNSDKFSLGKPVYCKHFRINGILDSDGDNCLRFNSFDCFGTIGAVNNKARKLYACNAAAFRQSLLPKLIMLIFPSCLPK